jgi:hypothetical protein
VAVAVDAAVAVVAVALVLTLIAYVDDRRAKTAKMFILIF